MPTINKIRVIGGGETYGLDGDYNTNGFTVQQLKFTGNNETNALTLDRTNGIKIRGKNPSQTGQEIEALIQVSTSSGDCEIKSSGLLRSWTGLRIGGDSSVNIGGREQFNIGVGSAIDLSNASKVFAIGQNLTSTNNQSRGQIIVGTDFTANNDAIFVAAAGSKNYFSVTKDKVATTLPIDLTNNLTVKGTVTLPGVKIESESLTVRTPITAKSLMLSNSPTSPDTYQTKDSIYLSRSTGKKDGATYSIVDGSIATIEEIKGDTVKSINLIPFPFDTYPVGGPHKGPADEEGVRYYQIDKVRDDGSITITTLATKESNIWVRLTNKTYFIKKGEYVLTSFNDNEIAWSGLQLYEDLSGENSLKFVSAGNITIEEDCYFAPYIVIAPNKSINSQTYFLMLVKKEDSENLFYVKDYSGLKDFQFEGIKSTGRNILNPISRLTPLTQTKNGEEGVTIQYLADEDCYLINGTVLGTSAYHGYSIQENILINDNITLSFNHIGGEITAPSGVDEKDIHCGFYVGQAVLAEQESIKNWLFIDFRKDSKENNNIQARQSNSAAHYIGYSWFYFTPGIIFNNYKVRIMVEKGWKNYKKDKEPVYEPYAESIYQLPEAISLGKWDTFDAKTGIITRQTGYATSETEFSEEELATYTDAIISDDRRSLAYKLVTPTIEKIENIPVNYYTVYNNGIEVVLDRTNDKYGVLPTITQTYSIHENPTEAATKAYVNNGLAKKLDKIGGVITGSLVVEGRTDTVLSALAVKNNNVVYGLTYDSTSQSFKLGLGSIDQDNNFSFNTNEGLPIALRKDSAEFADNEIIIWDAATKSLKPSGYLLVEGQITAKSTS